MIGLDLSGANLSGADLRGANLSVADLSVTDLSVADLSGINLIGTNLSGANLHMTDLNGANLSWGDMMGVYLIEANLSGARLYGADLRGANLRGANLYEADLSMADLRGANLSGAGLRRGELREADLREADLSGADLRNVDLSGADLRKADLSGVDLSDVYLLGAKVSSEQLAQAASLAGAAVPCDADTLSIAALESTDIVSTDAPVPPPAVVRLEPSTARVEAGEIVSVQVVVEDVISLCGAELHLTFDPVLLEVVDADPSTPGVQIQAGTFPSPDLVVQNSVDQVAGEIDFVTAQMPLREPVSGSGVLATITFRGKATGTFPLIFANVVLTTRNGEHIPATTQIGQVAVKEVEPSL